MATSEIWTMQVHAPRSVLRPIPQPSSKVGTLSSPSAMSLLQKSSLETKSHPGARESRSHANRNLDDKFRSLKSAPADNDVKLESNNYDNKEQSKDEPLPGITRLTSQRDVNAFFHHRMNGLADGVKDIKSSLKDLFTIIEGYHQKSSKKTPSRIGK